VTVGSLPRKPRVEVAGVVDEHVDAAAVIRDSGERSVQSGLIDIVTTMVAQQVPWCFHSDHARAASLSSCFSTIESIHRPARLVHSSADMSDVLTMTDVLTIRPKPDRRGPDRLEFPLCRVCGLADHVVVLRTPYVVHLRCPECGDLRPIGKPRRELPQAVGQ
jgi:hypothetical protein